MTLLQITRSRPFAAVVAGCVVAAAVIGLRRFGQLEALELAAYDALFRLKSGEGVPDPPLTVLSISEDDIQALGRWPLTDGVLAEALEVVAAQGPSAIGVDLFRDVPVPPGTERLREVLTADLPIVMVTKFGPVGVGPPPELAGTDRVGFNDVLVDPGGVVRRGLLFLDDGVTVSYSLALRLALFHLRPYGIAPSADPLDPQTLVLGHTAIPPLTPDQGPYAGADTRGYQFLLDFGDRADRIPTVPLTAVLSGEFDPAAFRDRIVLVGATSDSVKDYFYTPLSRVQRGRQHVFGVVLHAQTAGQLVRLALGRSPPIRTPSEGQEDLWVAVCGLLGGALALWARSPSRLALHILGGGVALAAAGSAAFLESWWIPVVPPALAWFAAGGAVTAYLSKQERRERMVLMQLFSKHVSPEVAQAIWKERHQILSQGRPRSQELVATVLFSDLSGFTAMSERLPPPELVDWLNEYMESMTRVVMAHDGVVDDYAGDGIKANFGVPVPRERESEIRQDAANAISCGLAMASELERLNRLWAERDLPPVRVRVGIHTGPVIAGALGSSERLKYTTIGDTVNVAARLESLDRESTGDVPCRIFVSESTLSHVHGRFRTESVGEVPLKGRQQKVAVFRVLLGDESAGTGDPEEMVS